ncbi:hypothetical protein RN001_005190 [Aquatica leii]|uniref:CCHC-type domain-containing protein n=1 Tax=Aquatica leii TaxID=1421715 RepID=A0AAN7PJH3_9COLE|nr:hypothetical protein RN001_005190 [Aquatica leii]
MAIILDGMKALKQLKDDVHKQNEKIDNVNQQLIVNQDKIKKQKSVDTKNDIKKCIDPTDMNITGIRPVSNGGILIECKNKDDVCKLKEKAETKMGESYKIQLPKKKLPRIKIVGLSENLPPEIIEEKIKMQNSHINSEKSSLKIVHTKEGRNRKSYITYAEVNAYTYRAIMKEEKINVGWDRCIVYDAIEIRRCYRCNGFNHKASECKAQKACPKCAGSHGLQECTVDGEENHKCSNCIQMAEKLKMKLDINHPTTAPQFTRSQLIFTTNLKSKIFQVNLKSYTNLKILYANKHFLTAKTRHILSNSLVLSHFNFADTVYEPCMYDADMKRVQQQRLNQIKDEDSIKEKNNVIVKTLKEATQKYCSKGNLRTSKISANTKSLIKERREMGEKNSKEFRKINKEISKEFNQRFCLQFGNGLPSYFSVLCTIIFKYVKSTIVPKLSIRTLSLDYICT